MSENLYRMLDGTMIVLCVLAAVTIVVCLVALAFGTSEHSSTVHHTVDEVLDND